MPFILILAALFAGAGYVAKKKQAVKGKPLPPSPARRTGSNLVRAGVLANRPDTTPDSRAVSDILMVGGPTVYSPQGVKPQNPGGVPSSGGGASGGGGASSGSGGTGSGGTGGGGFGGGGFGGSHPFLN
jgi:hypothetical protein